MTAIPEYPEGDDVCGFTYDHDTEITYEGEDGVQWECRRCGAEGWEDPAEPGSRPPMCEAHNHEGYGCTLDEGHDGRHQAGGSFPVRCWR